MFWILLRGEEVESRTSSRVGKLFSFSPSCIFHLKTLGLRVKGVVRLLMKLNVVSVHIHPSSHTLF